MSEFDILWAPWRLDFITEDEATKKQRQEENRVPVGPDADAECFLCQAYADTKDQKRHVFSRSDKTIGVLNRYPYNNGHLLIAPIRHIAKLSDLTGEEQIELTQQIAFWVERLENTLRPDGFNVGINLGRAAGAGLPGHLHWHIVPRWVGDTSFMSSISGAKVIPQSLDALWSVLVNSR